MTHFSLATDDTGRRGPEDRVRLHEQDEGCGSVEKVGANSGGRAQMSIESDGDDFGEDHREVTAEDGQREVHSDDVEHLPKVAV